LILKYYQPYCYCFSFCLNSLFLWRSPDEIFETNNVDSKWNAMKDVWQKATQHVCGWTKVPPRHSETTYIYIYKHIQSLTPVIIIFSFNMSNYLNLLFLIIKLTSSNPKSSPSNFTFLPLFQLNPTHPSDHTHFSILHLHPTLSPK